jgi:predicted kinase
MIVFLNGPFGVGKTTVARVLVETIPRAMLYDPELVGIFVRRLLGPARKHDDFQDYALWRTLVIAVACLLRATRAGPLVIPMTIWRRDYFTAVSAGLRRIDLELLCFRLTASENVLRQRILARPEEEGSHVWCLSHLEVGLAAANDPAFGTEIQTDDRTPQEVAEAIIESLDFVG